MIALLLVAWLPFLVRAVLLYAAANFQQASFLGCHAADIPRVPRLAEHLRLLRHDSRRRRADRRRSARQRAADLPVQTAHAASSTSSASWRSLGAFLTFVTWVPAMLLLLPADDVRGQHEVPARQPVPVPAITLFCLCRCSCRRWPCWRCRRCRRAGGSCRSSYAGIIFFTPAMQQALGDHRQPDAGRWISPGETLDVIGDAVFRLDAARRPIRCARHCGDRGAGRRRRSWCSNGACAAWRSSRSGDRRLAPVEVVRAGVRPERRHGRRAARHHGSAGAERCRQVDVHEAGDRTAQAEQGRAAGARASRSGGITRSTQRIGFCPEQDAFYERMTGMEWVTGAGAAERPVGSRRDRRGAARPRGRGSDRGCRQEDWRLQQGHATARQARAGHRPRSRAADPRRAAERHGPDQAPPDDSVDSGLGAAGHERARVEPRAARGGSRSPRTCW